jgi:L-lactate dehydrogenase complex protein LldF
LNTCPVYQRVGGHATDLSIPAPFGAVITPMFQGVEVAKDLPYASSLCGSCTGICPVKIDIHHMLLWLRKQVVESHGTPWQERLAMKLYLAGMSDSTLYRMGSRAVRWALKLSGRQSQPMKVPGWTETRDFPPWLRSLSRHFWKELEKKDQPRIDANGHK